MPLYDLFRRDLQMVYSFVVIFIIPMLQSDIKLPIRQVQKDR
jgi:hypothetical protein